VAITERGVVVLNEVWLNGALEVPRATKVGGRPTLSRVSSPHPPPFLSIGSGEVVAVASVGMPQPERKVDRVPFDA
jgi:hypothetical protein